MLALTGAVRLTKNVSSNSSKRSPRTSTLIVVDVLPAAIEPEPAEAV